MMDQSEEGAGVLSRLSKAAAELDALSARPIDDPERGKAYLRYLQVLKEQEQSRIG